MGSLEWKYVEPLRDEKTIETIEHKYNFKLPDDLKKVIVAHNAGVPSAGTLDFGNNKGKAFGGLLSFNEGDTDNVYDFVDMFVGDKHDSLRMFPFAIDPAGNFFCVKDDRIVLYDHESDKCIAVCDTFTQLLSMLY